jgi:hypothetical protein
MKLTILTLAIIAVACSTGNIQEQADLAVRPDDASLLYNGRIKNESDSVTIYWPGTSISFQFKGTAASALLRDELGENYFNVVIDNDSVRYFKTGTSTASYVLAQDLKDGPHTIRLIKRTEWDKGKTWFYGFQVRGELLPPAPRSKRVIEFFGNSITAGYAVENHTGGDAPDSIYTNNYVTYAAITARHFGADYYCTAKSGIGILVSWFPLTMPEMYDRLDPRDSTSKWDFSKVRPGVVVVNLLQNDSWLVKMPDHESFKQRFGTRRPGEAEIIGAYRSFISSVRKVYPEASIICALGSMDAVRQDSPWPGYVTAAVKGLNDKKIFTHFFPYMDSNGHPRKKENEAMANSLIDFIEKNISW